MSRHVHAAQASLNEAPLNGDDTNPNTFEEVYELENKIGTGGFGAVHVARNREKGDEFAVKVLNRSKLKGKDHDVVREVRTMRELSSHPNIVSLVDFFACPETFHVVLELARGGDLFDSLARRQNYTERDARAVAKEILTAVSYIHSKDFVHRDMKPENLLLANDENGVQVADFGFAKNLSEAPTPAGLVTRCGTPVYVAPELVKSVPYTMPVDIWGCGVILYLLLGGYQPFQGKGQVLFRQIVAADFEFHRKYWNQISVEAKQLITSMLAIDPKVRITANDALNSPWMTISDSNDSISTRHLDTTIAGLKKFSARRKLKGVMHMANIVRKLPCWDAGRVSFMPEDTTTDSTDPALTTLEKGKIGQSFDGMYSLLSELKSKGDTSVWKGLKKATRQPFAIKIIKRADSSNDDADVLSEVAILHSLRHKHVVRLHDYFEESSRFLLVMEFMTGGDVFDRILKNKQYSERDARELSLALLTAIEYIHSCSIAHRDLKPQNLLLETHNRDSSLKVADFGFARRVHTPLSLTTRCGTPTYVAPEILKNHPHDESSDMWSVGVTIFVALVGYPPFMEDRQRDLFRKIRQGQYQFHSTDWECISQQAKDMIISLLVVDPAHRSTAKEALQHPWICDMDERTLSHASLVGSQRKLMKSMEITSSPDIPQDAPWVTCATPLV